jgi:hypothetical protein
MRGRCKTSTRPPLSRVWTRVQLRNMNQNPRIRVIKRAERERQTEARAAQRPASVTRVAQVKALDAAATIAGWISKWQQQKEQSGISAFLTLSNARLLSKEAAKK